MKSQRKCWEEQRGGRKAQTELAGDAIAWVSFSFGKDHVMYRILLYVGLYPVLRIINIPGKVSELLSIPLAKGHPKRCK